GVEAPQAQASGALDLADDEAGDEEAGDDEEDVHPDEPAGKEGRPRVVEQDEPHGHGPQALDVTAEAGGGGGRGGRDGCRGCGHAGTSRVLLESPGGWSPPSTASQLYVGCDTHAPPRRRPRRPGRPRNRAAPGPASPPPAPPP